MARVATYALGMGVFGRRRPDVDKLRRKGDLERLGAAATFRDDLFDSGGVRWDLGAPVRVKALYALSASSGPAVDAAIVEGLRDPHPDVRLEAVRAAAQVRPEEAVEPLVDGVITWAGTDQRAAELARNALASWDLHQLPERVALEMAERVETPLTEAHRDALCALVAADSRAADTVSGAVTDVICRRLMDRATPEAVQKRCAEQMQWLGPRAADRLLEELSHGNASTAALGAVGGFRDARALRPLSEALRHGDPPLRAAAASALAETRDTRAVSELLRATQDADSAVRWAATAGLEAFGISAVIFGVAALTKSESAPEGVRGPHDGEAADQLEWAERVVARLPGGGPIT